MEQKFIDLFDTYTHGGMSRRAFLEKLAVMAGGTAAASTALSLLENNYAQAATMAEDDPRVKSGGQEIAPGVKGYLSVPREGSAFPAVIVIHENRGLNPHIRDVTRRMAVEGFAAFAPDYLSGQGGTP